jgi:hypothetical protein
MSTPFFPRHLPRETVPAIPAAIHARWTGPAPREPLRRFERALPDHRMTPAEFLAIALIMFVGGIAIYLALAARVGAI